jgi:hypothetical protein
MLVVRNQGRMLAMKRIALVVLAVVGWSALAGLPARADNAAAIQALQTLRSVESVNFIDVAARSDRWIYAKRALPSHTALTPLQVAIVSNPAVVAAITNLRFRGAFDLKSVYAARVEGARVYIYLGDPPP